MFEPRCSETQDGFAPEHVNDAARVYGAARSAEGRTRQCRFASAAAVVLTLALVGELHAGGGEAIVPRFSGPGKADAATTAPTPGAQNVGEAPLEERGAPAPAGPGRATQRQRTWEMPPVTVEAARLPELHEEELIGPNAQPRWSAHRRFPTTRIYVVPEGEIELEYWFRAKTPREGHTEYEHREEVEIGLPKRFQLDLYLIERHSHDLPTKFDQAVELRWAFADWDKIPGNPALYAEFINQQDDPYKVELKLLAGGQIAPRWHWGVNPVWEHETSGDRTNEFELTTGLSYTVVDERVAVGLEGKFAVANTKEDRDLWEEDTRLGPSIQFRPIPALHVDIAPLFGLTNNSAESDVYVVVGWEF